MLTPTTGGHGASAGQSKGFRGGGRRLELVPKAAVFFGWSECVRCTPAPPATGTPAGGGTKAARGAAGGGTRGAAADAGVTAGVGAPPGQSKGRRWFGGGGGLELPGPAVAGREGAGTAAGVGTGCWDGAGCAVCGRGGGPRGERAGKETARC